MNIQNSIRRLWRHIATTRRKQLSALFVVMLLASLAEVASIGAVLPFLGVLISPERVFGHPLAQQVISVIGIADVSQLLLFLSIAFIFAALLSGAMRLLLLWSQTRIGFSIGADLSFQIYKNILYQPYSVHVARHSSEVISGISNKANTVIYSALLPLLNAVSSGLILLAILIALIIIDPVVAVAAFGSFGALYAIIVLLTRRRLAYDSQRVSQESGQVIKALQEGLGGIRDVLIDGTQATYCKIYQDADLSLRRSQASIQVIGGAPRYLIESLGIALIALLAYWLSRRDDGIATAIPVLGALAVGAQRLLPVLQQLYGSWTAIHASQASLEDVLDLLEQTVPEYANDAQMAPIRFNKSIRIERLSFRYSNAGPWVLREVDCEIPKGGRIGFIGATGSGKSTLLDLVMGLLQPTEGLLMVDETTVTARNFRSWQANIAHVPQAIFLADTTIAENIAFGIPRHDIDLDRVRIAARQAQIHTTIESWEKQYDTRVGERGVRLSGGQRQRIGIARALYKQADFIVFDEATSALDGETERAVMDAINSISRDITFLIVAHRLTTLRGCDRIVELDGGRVRRIGSFDEIVHFPDRH